MRPLIRGCCSSGSFGLSLLMRRLGVPLQSCHGLEPLGHLERGQCVNGHPLAVDPPLTVVLIIGVAERGIATLLHAVRYVTTGVSAGELTMDLGSSGVKLRPVYTPRLHAKLLAWDDDSLAITSQNWLSADPADNAALRELGLFINAPKVADQVIRLFKMQLS
jgi:hypothetical protein